HCMKSPARDGEMADGKRTGMSTSKSAPDSVPPYPGSPIIAGFESALGSTSGVGTGFSPVTAGSEPGLGPTSAADSGFSPVTAGSESGLGPTSAADSGYSPVTAGF